MVYAPGELRAVAYKNGAAWAKAVQRTAGPAARLELVAERRTLRADGRDLAFVTVRVLDADGLLVPRAKIPLRFSVGGGADLVATDNGDATSHVPFASAERPRLNAPALAIVRPRAGQPGEFTVTVETEGPTRAVLALRSE